MLEISKHKAISGLKASVSGSVPCLFGVSVNGGETCVQNLEACWNWTRARFDTCAVLLGDSLQRLTVEAQLGLDPKVSEIEAGHQAARLEKQIRAVLGPGPAMIRTSSVAARAEFRARLAVFATAFTENASFREAILVDARDYCRRQDKRGRLRVPLNTAIELAVQYLLEEVAIYDVLARDGWLVETYQGSELRALMRFMRGDFSGLAPALEQRTHISLRIHQPRVAA